MSQANEKRVIVITGGNTGMGFETALALAGTGQRVIIGCRSPEKGARAAESICTQTKAAGGSAESLPLDLNSFASVRRFADAVVENYPQISTLVCNAGIMNAPYASTEDGYESQFQVNYLSHFLLANLLLKPLLAGAGGGLISISSLSSEKGKCDSAEDFVEIGRCAAEDYTPIDSYRESKLAQVIFTAEAHRRYHSSGLVTSAVHPGVVNTDLFTRDMPKWISPLIQPIAWLGYSVGFLKTPREGAETAIYLATEQEKIESGKYWENRKPRLPNPRTNDENLGRKLWEVSAELVALSRV